jgi:hypothetical protein
LWELGAPSTGLYREDFIYFDFYLNPIGWTGG